MIELSDADAGSSHLLARGEEVLVRLPENPTTGYRWQFTQYGRGKLRLVDDRFEPGGGGAVVPGAAGLRVVRFAAETSGAVRLEALERRGWEPAGATNKRNVYAIVVR